VPALRTISGPALAPLLALLLALGVAGCTDDDGGDAGGAEDVVEDVVEAVVEARTTGDCDGYEDYFVDGDPVGSCEEGDVDPVVGGGPEIREAEVDGDSATVEVVDHYDCSGWDEDDVEYVDVYSLVEEDGEWLVEDIEFSETTSDDCFS